MDEPLSYEYVGTVNGSLECAICRQAFVAPSMAPTCQHVFCRRCITRALASSKSCPIDRGPLRETELVDAPRIVQQMVDELAVRCPNHARGCAVECERALLAGHLRDACEAGSARAEQLAPAPAPCDLCGDDVGPSPAATRAHLGTCTAAPTTCLHCSASLTRGQLPSHFLACPSIPIPCPHAAHGCPFRLARSAMVDEHLEVSCAYEPIKGLLTRYDARLDDAQAENGELRQRCEVLEEGMRELREGLECARRSLGELWVDPPRPRRPSDVDLPADDRARVRSPRTSDSPSLFALPTSPSPSPARHRVPPLASSHSPSPPTHSHHLASPPLSHHALAPAPAPLPTLLTSLSHSIASLASDLSALDARQHSTLVNETLRIQDDVQSVRGVLHGVRMQMHWVLMELGRVQVGGIGHGDGEGSSSNSDDDSGPRRFFAPGLQGMGPMPVPILGNQYQRQGIGMGASPTLAPFPHGGGMKL